LKIHREKTAVKKRKNKDSDKKENIGQKRRRKLYIVGFANAATKKCAEIKTATAKKARRNKTVAGEKAAPEKIAAATKKPRRKK
jgi:hypothetical protein